MAGEPAVQQAHRLNASGRVIKNTKVLTLAGACCGDMSTSIFTAATSLLSPSASSVPCGGVATPDSDCGADGGPGIAACVCASSCPFRQNNMLRTCQQCQCRLYQMQMIEKAGINLPHSQQIGCQAVHTESCHHQCTNT